MPSNNMRKLMAQHPEWTREQIDEERERRIHHVGISMSERAKMRGWSSPADLPDQDTLF